KFAFRRLVLLRIALRRVAPRRFARLRSALLRSALRRFTPRRLAPRRSAPVRSGRTLGFRALQRFQASWPLFRISKCSLFAFAHPILNRVRISATQMVWRPTPRVAECQVVAAAVFDRWVWRVSRRCLGTVESWNLIHYR